LESSEQQDLASRLRPRDVQDVIADISLFRFGPVDGGRPAQRIAARHGTEPVYPHPDLEPILRDTYGVVIWQEHSLSGHCVQLASPEWERCSRRSTGPQPGGRPARGCESVADPARIPWIGHLGEALRQPGQLLGLGPGMLAELVKGAESAMMRRPARPSRQVTGRRDLHDLGSRACPASRTESTWQTITNRAPDNYAEALLNEAS
jgi:hypothetical protein